MRGNFSAARERFEESLAIDRGMGDRYGEAFTLHGLGNLERKQANYSAAREFYKEALALRKGLPNLAEIVLSCTAGGGVLAALGCFRPAALSMHGAMTCAIALSYKFEADDQQVLDTNLARLDTAVASGDISADDLAQWKAQGESMSLDELAEFTLKALAEDSDGYSQPSAPDRA